MALVALLLLALPILIHMLTRSSGRKLLFPTIRFLRPAKSHSLTLEKIEGWPLLALRLFAMSLLALAISGPRLPGNSRSRARLLLLDASLSMNSETLKNTVADRAREIVSSLAAEDFLAIARFDDSVNLLCDFTKDRFALERAISTYNPRYGEADLNEAFRWASEKLVAEARSRELILISDLQATNVRSFNPIQLDGIDLKVIRANSDRHINARIDRINVRAAGEIIEADSTALVDDEKGVSVQPINLKATIPGASAGYSSALALLSAERIGNEFAGGAVAANRADDFDADDIRFFVARIAGESKIMIVQPRFASTDQATFIEKALQANEPAGSSRAIAERSDALPETADALSNIRAVIAPVEALSKSNMLAAREHARKGGSLILTLGAETDSSQATEKLAELDERFNSVALHSIAATDTLGLLISVAQSESAAGDEPSFDANLLSAFASVRFRAALSVRLSEGETLVKYSDSEPAVVRLSVGAGQILLLGFGLSDKDSSLARSPAFPAFVEWLTDNIVSGERAMNLEIGQASVSSMARNLNKLTRIYSKNGQAQPEAVSDYQSALAEPGVYEGEDSRGKIVFSVNASVRESSLAQSSEQEILERITINKIVSSGTDSGKTISSAKSGLWRVIAIVALAASLMELILSVRRKRRSQEA